MKLFKNTFNNHKTCYNFRMVFYLVLSGIELVDVSHLRTCILSGRKFSTDYIVVKNDTFSVLEL